MNLIKHPAGGFVCCIVVAMLASSCAGSAPRPEAGASRTSFEFQSALVENVVPVEGEVLISEPIEIEPTKTEQFPEVEWRRSEGETEVQQPEDHRLVAHLDASVSLRTVLRYDDAMLAALASELEARGIPEAVSPEPAPAQSKGWSAPGSGAAGTDSRVDLSGHPNWEYRTIGRLWAAGGCTGTLFGRRLVITAAHCIIDPDGNYHSGVFQPATNGGTLPYGKQKVVAAWWGGKYIPNCTGGVPGYWSQCLPEDWALLVLEDKFPSGHPGWLGYGWLGENDIRNLPKRQNGYPGCSPVNSPAGCQAERLYGQTSSCSFGEFMYPFSSGFNSTYSHGCDNSPGMSGSAMYTTGLGGFHIFGVESVERCTTCTVAEEPSEAVRKNPNLDKRIDSFIFNLMSNLRAAFP